MTDHSTEKIINLRDLFFYVLKKWRWICLFLIIGLAVGCLYSYKQMRDNQPEALEAKVLALDEDKDLDMPRIRQYADYKELYQNQLDSEELSILLKMDPENVWTGEIRYFISADRENIDSVSAEYSSIMRQAENIERMIGAYGSEITERQIRDLVGTSFTRNAVDSDISLEETYMLRTGIATAYVTAQDESTCRALLDELKVIYSETNSRLLAEYGGDFSARDLNEYVQFGYSSSVQNALQTAVETRKGYLTQITNLEKDMTTNDKLYYKYFYETDKAKEAAGFSKKWVVLLGVGAAVLCAVWFAVRYFLDTHVKSTDEFSEIYNTNVLAVLPEQGKKKTIFIDRWLDRWDHKGKAPVNDISYASAAVAAMEFDRALLCGDPRDASEKAVMDELTGADKRLIPTGNLGDDKDAQAALRESDGAVLVAKLLKSRNAEIRREIDVAEAAGKKILGVVVIE